jgi:hypothetical protein
MGRRNGRPGDYLVTDQYLGVTTYASKVRRDFWGSLVQKPLQRNLQEISQPLLDPYPVPYVTGSSYERVPNTCIFERIPFYIGNTTIRTPLTSPAAQALYNTTGIGDMSVGCTFVVS